MQINLIFRPWMTILIVMVPFAARFNKWTGGKPEEIDVIASRLDETKREKQIPTSLDLFMIMGVGLVIVAFGFHMGDFLGALIPAVPAQVWLYLMVTAIGVIIGTTTEFGYINGLELIGGTLAIFALSVSSSNVDLRSFGQCRRILPVRRDCASDARLVIVTILKWQKHGGVTCKGPRLQTSPISGGNVAGTWWSAAAAMVNPIQISLRYHGSYRLHGLEPLWARA
ncbi:MAG: DUF819 family protein [Enterocloster sp.]